MISIIIPIYNTPPFYLRRCLKSIQAEDYEDYEILLIDDGSEDKECRKCLLQLKTQDERIVLISQLNQGVSAARNMGIIKAKGDFLVFIDADDEILPGFLKESVKLAQKEKLDIVYGSIQYEPDEHGTGIQGPKGIQIYEGDEITDVKKSILGIKIDGIRSNILGSPCARLYRTHLVKEIMFRKEIKIYEDQLFNLGILDLCNRIAVVPEFWYKYYQNDFSALHNVKGAQEYIPYYEMLLQYGNKQENLEIREAIYNKILGLLSMSVRDVVHGEDRFELKMVRIQEMVQKPLFSEAIDNLKINSNVLGMAHRLRLLCLKRRWYIPLYVFQKILRSK